MVIGTIIAKFESGNLIAFVALILAYLAYRKSLVDEYKSWLDLVKSFQSELKYAQHWIGTEYKDVFYKEWLDPSKIVYPLTSEAAKALIWKGHPPKNLFPRDFFDKLAIYNERIQAFNHLLSMQALNYVINLEGKKAKVAAKHINSVIHNNLIGSKGEWPLHDKYIYFNCEITKIIDKDLSIMPWYLKHPVHLILIACIAYLIIDYQLM